MKNFYLAFLFCLLSGFLFETIAQTIYVDSAATTGMNTGTSWDDAYTDLQMALTNAGEGDEIRVAQGTYLPGTDPTATFLIDKNIQLLGGYNADTGDRDPEMYETILSGDPIQDDMNDDFVMNKDDNVWTVVTIDATITNATLIEGFTIRGGHADGSGVVNANGGGVHSLGAPVIRNCLFEQNYALKNGGGLRFKDSGCEGALIENCRFENNHVEFSPFDNGGGGLNIEGVSGEGITIHQCQFMDNDNHRGSGLQSYNSNLIVTNSAFTGNISEQIGGGLYFRAEAPNLTLSVDGCTFAGNEAADGGGLYVEAAGENNSITIKKSEFLNNTSNNNFGGGALVWFSGQESWGEVLIDSCRFEGNTSAYGTAGLDIGSPPKNINTPTSHYTITNCQFLNNEAEVYAGAMELWAEDAKAEFQVSDCQFDGNSSVERTGAVSVFTTSSNFKANIERCVFRNNESAVGAAIAVNNLDFNLGIFPKGAELILDNCLVADNSGDQAIIAIDSFPDVQLINCTIANNMGGGIEIENLSGLTLQNTILYNPGYSEFEALTGDVTVTSIGGNLFGDNTLMEHAHPSDHQNADPLLTNDFHLMEGSPAVDAGMDSGDLPATDLAGNDRFVNCVDIGAYESSFTTAMVCLSGVGQVIAGEIGLFPNPVTDYLHLQLPETVSQSIEISILDTQGKLVKWITPTIDGQVNVRDLFPGMYLVKAIDGDKAYIGRFVKQ